MLRPVVLALSLAHCFPLSLAAQSVNASPPAPAQEAPSAAERPWWERLTFSGDFRARFEGFYQDELPTRQRGRYRLRLGLRAPLTDDLTFAMRLASGHEADVTSTNQTLSEFWNRKPINIDQALLTYTPSRAVTLGAGKFNYPLTRTQMVWDDDVNWEGAYEQVSWHAEPVAWRVVAVQSPLSDLSTEDDAFMFGQYVQAGMRLGGHRLQLSVADYAFREPDQIAIALDRREVIRTQQTNTLRRERGRVVGYASGFNLVDVIAQLTVDTGREAYPVVLLGDYVVNTRAHDDDDTGVWLHATYGRAAAVKTWSAGFTYARIERDAVLSAFNFSDMGPATNVVMQMATFSFMPKRRLNLDATTIFTRELRPVPGVPNPVLMRLQVDARVSF